MKLFLADEKGLPYGVKHVGNKPRVSAMPYTYDIAEGSITGHSSWSKIGFNAAVTTEQDIAPYLTGPYTFPSGELTMTIASDSDNDDPVFATPTGAWTVTVYYLNANYVERSITVTLAGKSAVTIGTDVFRVQNARIMTCGTAYAAVGNLSIKSGATTHGYISATKTRMRQCIWTVPTGKTLYITQISFSCADQSASKYARFTTMANFDDKSATVLQRGLFMPYSEVLLNNTAYTRELCPPTKLPATTDLRVKCFANSAAAVTCRLNGWIETA
jgi:hypothetical protein